MTDLKIHRGRPAASRAIRPDRAPPNSPSNAAIIIPAAGISQEARSLRPPTWRRRGDGMGLWITRPDLSLSDWR